MSDEHKFGAPKPVEQGQVLELEVEAVNGHGEGIAKHEGFVIFVRGAAKGRCKAKVVEVKRTFAYAERTRKG